MPEQSSKRGDVVTPSRFTGPFENQLVRFGVKGLNLKDSLDALEGWARHTNLDHDNMGEATTRPGQTTLATAGTAHHSVRKLNDEAAGTYTRLWGVDTNLYIGAVGAIVAVDGGYSGDPLTLLPHRPTLSGDPWMFVADSDRMRKVRADGLDLPIGLPAPALAAAVALGAEHQTMIANCDPTDATNAANWIPVAGLKDDGTPTSAPNLLDDASPAGPGIALYTHPLVTGGTATARLRSLPAPSRYDSWAGIALARDLNIVGGIAASDDDVIHLWMKTSHPQLIKEIRIYLVVSATFNATVLPGTPSAVAGNEDAYVKGFRQNDFVQFIQASQTQIDAAETARVYAMRDQDLDDRAQRGRRAGPAKSAEEVTDPSRAKTKQIGAGVHQWFELGSLGLSLRRGDFQRIGNSAGRDWSTVTGLILYVAADLGDPITGVEVGLEGVYLTGGHGPDTMEPGAQPYDFRYTNYDPRTGAESNGSPELADPTVNGIDSLRREIRVTPAAYGDASVRQRFYRRGGSIVDDWYYEGENVADGGVFSAVETDDAISAAPTLPIDHFQPVPTIDDTGATVLAQPIPTLWGPLEGMLFGCGDPYRPGHLYYCLPDAPDHWSASGNVEVCPPSEVLMNGGLAGAQAFVFSKARLYAVYPNLTGVSGSVTAPPTLCKRGLLGRWAMAVGPGGIYFVAEDGIFVTTGGPEEWISREIDPLFLGMTKHGLLPIDKSATTRLRLTVWENKLYFSYIDTALAPQVLVYSILNKFWRHYSFGRLQRSLQGEDEDLLLIGSDALGKTYTHEGTTDDTLPIAWAIRTGAVSGGSREEKLFGDQFIDLDSGGEEITVQNFLDEETFTNLAQVVNATAGRQRYVFDAFGSGPQKAHSLSMEVQGSATLATRPVLYQAGVAVTLQPDLTTSRVTNWDDLGASDEVWLSGVTFDCDTGGVSKTVLIERDYNGVRSTVATLTVMTDGRHKVSFSWPAVPARLVRVHPDSAICEFWLLYRADWIWVAEPPRISAWDIHFENGWDQYYTGLDLYCDTGGLEKHIEVYVDGVRLTNTLGGGITYWPVTANGRRVVHLTLPWGRGHVFRFVAIDTNPGLLYQHRWQLQEEPSEQANWNQNFSILGSRADKWLKAVIFECDTFGADKQVQIEADGASVETITVNTNGRKVVQEALSVQQLGRVWRMFPVDGNPGRLYTAQPVFDEEPFCLDRWETQETTHGIPGWFAPLYGHIVLKSTLPVALTLIVQHNQPRAGSTAHRTTTTYTIPSTVGLKSSHFQSFEAGKGVLIRYILTSAAPFWLYKAETVVVIQPWGAGQPITVKPFGDDDQDETRAMRQSVIAAERSGGSAS
jgi:hypothetical protein